MRSVSPELGWTILAAIVMVVGLCGVVVPVLPGLALIWFTAVIYGFVVGFGTVGIGVMAALTALVVAGLVKGIVIPRRRAAMSGASGWSQLGGVIGAVFGFFIIPVLGVIVGALAGVLLVEAWIRRNWGDAWTATAALAKGFGISVLIDFGLGLVMIGLWSIWAATVLF